MLASVYYGPWTVSLEDRPEPQSPLGNHALVAVRASGICGTDLGIISGEYEARVPVILGHECAGEVIAKGEEVSSLHIGDRVVVDPTFYCDACAMCRTGRENHCEKKHGTETGVSRDGTFTSFYVTEERFLYRIDDHVSFPEAVLTEPLSCVLTGVSHLRIFPGECSLVIGAGPIGLLYALVLNLRGLSGRIVEKSESRRELSLSLLGKRWIGFASLDDVLAASASNEEVFDLVVDTTGLMSERVIPMMSRGGQLLLVGLRDGMSTFNPGDLANKSLSIIGSIDSLGTFAAAYSLIANGAIPARDIVTHSFALSDIFDALRLLGCDMKTKRRQDLITGMKIVIEP
jgi:L-iditol 2-dehydrogenase